MKKLLALGCLGWLVTICGCAGDKTVAPISDGLGQYAKQTAHRLMVEDVSDQEVVTISSAGADTVSAVIEAGLVELGISATERQLLLEELALQLQLTSSKSDEHLYSCKQNVEMENGSNGQRNAYTYVSDVWCDGSPDTDWKYRFSPAWAYNPDNLRWWARSGWVRYVFQVFYGGNLLGCSLCTSPVDLILGTNGVAAAGGPEHVKNELFIWSH
jgi:hypothetical protein